MKPFVHAFKTLSGYYFYDVNKNDVKSISEELYNYLICIQSDVALPFLSAKSQTEIENLYEMGFLSSNRIEVFEHPRTKYMNEYLSRKLGRLTIQVTQNCNLRCSYCPYTSNNGLNRLHNSKKIDFETIKKGLEYIRFNSIDNDEIALSFYGGEPLLEYELIKKTVKLSKDYFVGKKYSLFHDNQWYTV